MALLRILVDGYSLLHSWPELAPGRPRYSAEAREELIHWLTQYRDVIGTSITIVFDGGRAPKGRVKPHSTREMEILYSKSGQTADEVIERAAHRLLAFGEVLVITNDQLECETVHAVGGHVQSCDQFIRAVTGSMEELQRDVKNHNLRERNQFARKHYR